MNWIVPILKIFRHVIFSGGVESVNPFARRDVSIRTATGALVISRFSWRYVILYDRRGWIGLRDTSKT
jgi:hypothetical protein